MSSHPHLHFYQVSSKYSKGYSSYRADKKFYADADANRIRPKNNMPPTLVGGGHNSAQVASTFEDLSAQAPCNVLNKPDGGIVIAQ